MAFNTQRKFKVTSEGIPLRKFSLYKERYIIRPPYQRNLVWTPKKERQLLDSLLRRSYIPRIVLREVSIEKNAETKLEVIDGQQRIKTVQKFYTGELTLPKTLQNIDPRLPEKRYMDLPPDIRQFIDDELKFEADIIIGIEDPRDYDHWRIASDMFWRLQQGESLTTIELVHARLFSRLRNFMVKYGDDYDFSYKEYLPIDENEGKHRFFEIYNTNNIKMKHLALIARLFLIEKGLGTLEPAAPQDANNKDILKEVEDSENEKVIGDTSLEKEKPAQSLVKNLDLFYKLFCNDPIYDSESGIRELSEEYFVISVYLLLRYINSNYVFNKQQKKLFVEFVIEFHRRWKSSSSTDTEILLFYKSRGLQKQKIEARDSIIRLAFFQYAEEKGDQLQLKDRKRSFSELDRLQIYRKYDGICQSCKETVPWSRFQADHIYPHSKGGKTTLDNAQLLCRDCNLHKSNSLPR